MNLLIKSKIKDNNHPQTIEYKILVEFQKILFNKKNQKKKCNHLKDFPQNQSKIYQLLNNQLGITVL